MDDTFLAQNALTLDTPLTKVMGARSATLFAKALETYTVFDFVSHYPRRYATRGVLTPVSGVNQYDQVTIVGQVISARDRPLRARRGNMLEVLISDGEQEIKITFFNQKWRAEEFLAGKRGLFSGKISYYNGDLRLNHPEYELFAEADSQVSRETLEQWTQTPIPIYPATRTATNMKIQKAMTLVLDQLGEIESLIPPTVLEDYTLLEYRKALEYVHRPFTMEEKNLGSKSLRFHEAFILQAALGKQRQAMRARSALPRQAYPGGMVERFDAQLPFEFTEDQMQACEQISSELSHTFPMQRLIQGEVGSGKTVVALRAMLIAAESGGQCVFLTPTEVLASQHMRSLRTLLSAELTEQLQPTLLTSSMKTAEKKQALLAVAAGSAKILVGTHAVLNDLVSFHDLALVIVDEQHRFGVEQREKLRTKTQTVPHLLILTATPIPRTIAMTVFGDIDVSTIAQLPKGRAGVESFVVDQVADLRLAQRVWGRVAEEVQKGHQVFVVCPGISPQEKTNTQGADTPCDDQQHFAPPEQLRRTNRPVAPMANVETMFERLSQMSVLEGAQISMLHGAMASAEKEDIMNALGRGEIDVLVSTTIIEVGVDVPNATVMVVCDAERFGISQLHQLRGRVGRGQLPGLCLLLTQNEPNSPGRVRVESVAATTDGFELAVQDLESRREGDILGTRQSGKQSSLRLLRVTQDEELIIRARKALEEFFGQEIAISSYPPLEAAVARYVDFDSQTFLSKY